MQPVINIIFFFGQYIFLLNLQEISILVRQSFQFCIKTNFNSQFEQIYLQKGSKRTFSDTNKQMIYFGDAQLVERHLHEDLNKIIKIVKIRQEQHLQLLEYNKAISTKKRSIESTIFINDQITTHNLFLIKVCQVNKEISKQQQEIIEKYDQSMVKFESVLKLMSRVVTRILQMNQTFIDKIKVYDDGLFEQFVKMKNTLTKLINQKDSIDLGSSTKTVIEYARHKNLEEIQKLKRLIKTLQDGELEKIPYIYKGLKVPEKQSVEPVFKAQTMHNLKMQKQKSLTQKTISSPVKKEQKSQLTVAKLKSQLKAQELQKKNKKMFATRMATMYNPLDISKKDFIDQILTTGPKQFDRIYGEILLRNKFNQQQILGFQSKKVQFDEKIKQFKEMMIVESQRIQEVLMIKKPLKVQKRADTLSEEIQTKQQNLETDQQKNPQIINESFMQSPTREFKRSFILRQKQQGSPRFHKQTQFTQLRVTQQNFNHIKFDASNQQIFLRSNRNRLPSIQNKQSVSIDSHVQPRYYNVSKSKDQKSHVQRKNFLMKNIQLGVQNVIKHHQQRNLSENKNITQKLKQIQPINNNSFIGMTMGNINTGTHTSLGMNLMEFTFYGAKKKSYVLGDTKNNFVF